MFNLYRRMNKLEHISEISHTVVSESCLHYLTIGNWFPNLHLFNLQWTIWMYFILTYNLFCIQWFKEVNYFSLVFIWLLLKNHKYYYFIDLYRKKAYTCIILYCRRKFYINNIFISRVMKKIITICRECLYWVDEIKGRDKNCVVKMYLKNYFFFFKPVDCIKKIFKLSLKFLVLSLTDVERGREGMRGRNRDRAWETGG